MSGRETPFSLLVIGSLKKTGEDRFFDVLDAALRGGADAFLLREKEAGGALLFRLAAAARERTRRAGALLLVSDRIDVALAAGADGVHLPENSFAPDEARRLLPPNRLIGRSVHDEAGAREAERRGADYVVVGPLFATPGKERFALGLEKARTILAAVSIPVLAVGGITESNAPTVAAAGFTGAAVIRAVASAADPERAASRIRAPFLRETP